MRRRRRSPLARRCRRRLRKRLPPRLRRAPLPLTSFLPRCCPRPMRTRCANARTRLSYRARAIDSAEPPDTGIVHKAGWLGGVSRSKASWPFSCFSHAGHSVRRPSPALWKPCGEKRPPPGGSSRPLGNRPAGIAGKRHGVGIVQEGAGLAPSAGRKTVGWRLDGSEKIEPTHRRKRWHRGEGYVEVVIGARVLPACSCLGQGDGLLLSSLFLP